MFQKNNLLKYLKEIQKKYSKERKSIFLYNQL